MGGDTKGDGDDVEDEVDGDNDTKGDGIEGEDIIDEGEDIEYDGIEEIDGVEVAGIGFTKLYEAKKGGTKHFVGSTGSFSCAGFERITLIGAEVSFWIEPWESTEEKTRLLERDKNMDADSISLSSREVILGEQNEVVGFVEVEGEVAEEEEEEGSELEEFVELVVVEVVVVFSEDILFALCQTMSGVIWVFE